MSRKHRPRRIRLPRWQEIAVYVSMGALMVTGLGWLALDQLVRVNGEFGPEHHPAEHGALIIHGVAAYAFLVVGGAMIPVHVKAGWNADSNKVSGLSLGIGCILAAITALALYYLGGEGSRAAASLAHWIIGLLLIPTLLIHALRGRRGA